MPTDTFVPYTIHTDTPGILLIQTHLVPYAHRHICTVHIQTHLVLHSVHADTHLVLYAQTRLVTPDIIYGQFPAKPELRNRHTWYFTQYTHRQTWYYTLTERHTWYYTCRDTPVPYTHTDTPGTIYTCTDRPRTIYRYTETEQTWYLSSP